MHHPVERGEGKGHSTSYKLVVGEGVNLFSSRPADKDDREGGSQLLMYMKVQRRGESQPFAMQVRGGRYWKGAAGLSTPLLVGR